ncbi:MAG: GNAT family N-acetyltransferase [Pseudolabrys sp.]
MSDAPSDDVRDNPAHHRFELEVDGHLAIAVYSLAAGVITFIHTEVPEALAGRGVGSRLAKGALAQVRARGLKVVPRCPFIRGYIEKHPEWQDLLA